MSIGHSGKAVALITVLRCYDPYLSIFMASNQRRSTCHPKSRHCTSKEALLFGWKRSRRNDQERKKASWVWKTIPRTSPRTFRSKNLTSYPIMMAIGCYKATDCHQDQAEEEYPLAIELQSYLFGAAILGERGKRFLVIAVYSRCCFPASLEYKILCNSFHTTQPHPLVYSHCPREASIWMVKGIYLYPSIPHLYVFTVSQASADSYIQPLEKVRGSKKPSIWRGYKTHSLLD